VQILVCPTAFKESLSAGQAAQAILDGVRTARPEAGAIRLPVSDGGPGLLEAVLDAEGGEVRMHDVHGPMGEPARARSLWLSTEEVVLETADACGLHLAPTDRRDPLRADTIGVGELVRACIEQGATRLNLGLGGSATVDGGTGLARALGYRFLGPGGADLPPGGGSLPELARIEPAPSVTADLEVTAIADVRAPLCGPDGAARRFGPQKGAGAGAVETLERGLVNLSERFKEDLGRDVAELPGAGASGGLGAGCAAFLDAKLVPGSEWVLDRLRFHEVLERADLVITGEGAWDATSAMGKITWEILRRARASEVPAALVCGRLAGPVPPGVRVIGGEGRWLSADDLTRLVAEALG
jgi:glycerate kinase